MYKKKKKIKFWTETNWNKPGKKPLNRTSQQCKFYICTFPFYTPIQHKITLKTHKPKPFQIRKQRTLTPLPFPVILTGTYNALQLSIEFVSNGYLQNPQLTFCPPRIFLPHANIVLERRIIKLCTPRNRDIIIWAFLIQFQHYMFLQHKECVEFLGHLKSKQKSSSITQT